MHVQCKMGVRFPNYCCREKAVSITYSQCVSIALVISTQRTCSVLCCHLWPVWLYHIFPHDPTEVTIFGDMILDIKCVFGFATILSETFLIIRRIQRDIIVTLHRSSCKVLIVLVSF
jgi:hypothetical protein